MIFFGRKASKIAQLDVQDVRCNYCENTDTQHLSVFGKYAHVYWIPFFPTGREVVSECTHCKRTISRKEFSEELNWKYEENKGRIKRPMWHWMGSAIIGGLILLFTLSDLVTKDDPRKALLDADIERMHVNPDQETDTLAFSVKMFFMVYVTEEMNPDEFEYFAKTESGKVLILIKIPEFKNVEKEGRLQALELVDKVFDVEENLKDLDRYIGIHGKYNMMMVKTPDAFENGNIVSPDPLYEFYGPLEDFEN